MTRRLTAVALAGVLALASAPAFAQTPVLSGAMYPCNQSTGSSQCFKPPIAGVPLGYQQLTTISAATNLTVPAFATEAIIICTGQTVFWRDDGTAPTATVGMPLVVNTYYVYTGKLSAFQVIQSTATAVCDVSYYQ